MRLPIATNIEQAPDEARSGLCAQPRAVCHQVCGPCDFFPAVQARLVIVVRQLPQAMRARHCSVGACILA